MKQKKIALEQQCAALGQKDAALGQEKADIQVEKSLRQEEITALANFGKVLESLWDRLNQPGPQFINPKKSKSLTSLTVTLGLPKPENVIPWDFRSLIILPSCDIETDVSFVLRYPEADTSISNEASVIVRLLAPYLSAVLSYGIKPFVLSGISYNAEVSTVLGKITDITFYYKSDDEKTMRLFFPLK